MVFKVLFYFVFKPKTSKGRIFWFLWFLDIFRIHFALIPYGYYFFVISLLSMYMNLHSFIVYTPSYRLILLQ